MKGVEDHLESLKSEQKTWKKLISILLELESNKNGTIQ